VGSVEREYEYRPKWTMIVLCGAFFGLCAAVLGAKAANNDRGVIINRIVELGPDGATTFYWVLAALSAGFVALAAFLAYHRLTYRQRLAFGPAALTVPASQWSRKEKEIAYRDIVALSEATISGQRFLYVAHLGGKHTITASMLPSKAAFVEVCELLAARVREAHAAEPRHAEPGAAADGGA
jgi:acyl-coenzyme A synthetase/AMP-(fatty) acid ligase